MSKEKRYVNSGDVISDKEGREYFRLCTSWQTDKICDLLNKQDEQIAELKAENEKLIKVNDTISNNGTYDELRKIILEGEEISNAKALEQVNADNKILEQEIKELKANTDGTLIIKLGKLGQQLKEKEQEIKTLKQTLINLNKQLEHWQECAVTQNDGLTSEGLSQILKTNTKQVCDKIREKVKKIEFNQIPEKVQQAIKFSVCYEIDQIEKGEV